MPKTKNVFNSRGLKVRKHNDLLYYLINGKSQYVGHVKITDEDWNTILLSLRIKLKSPAVQGSDREARDWQRDLKDVIQAVVNGEYGEINDADWTEIYYALTDGDVEGAEYIADRIGPDGKRMWTGSGQDR